MITPSGRKVSEGKRSEKKKRERKIAVNSGNLVP
jgi:hypothetical protein